jgi:methylphosphotriester-DNA--protein-cysteine methyltransferase
MSEKNPDLIAVSQQINDAMAAIEARKATASTPADFQALNGSLAQLNQRLQSVNGLIFAERSDTIAQAAAEVEEAEAELADAIRSAEQVNRVIASVTGFLGLVDRVIGAASGLPGARA